MFQAATTQLALIYIAVAAQLFLKSTYVLEKCVENKNENGRSVCQKRFTEILIREFKFFGVGRGRAGTWE